MGFNRGKLDSNLFGWSYCCSRCGGRRVKRLGSKRRRRIEKKMWKG